MKYVITGGAGHISGPLAETLLDAGQQVTVIGRSAEHLRALTEKGAGAAVGSIEDEKFLESAFAGADAAYLMIPPNFAVESIRAFQNKVAKNYVAAVKANQVKNVVILSSFGAHIGNATGPVDGLSDFEGLVSELKDVNVKVLRPVYFMYNLMGNIPMVKSAGIMGANFGADKVPLVHTNDIATVAAEELLTLSFKGFTIRYIASDEKTGAEIAEILNAAANTSAPWVVFSDEQAVQGMKDGGLPDEFANAYATMGRAIREGRMGAHYWQEHPELGKTDLEDFAQEWAAAYGSDQPAGAH